MKTGLSQNARQPLIELDSGSLPAKADVVAQREFYNNTLRPLMEKAKAGTVALLFMDAAHFVMGCDFLGYIYCKTRRFIKTWCGRKRYNVLGALDFVTKKVVLSKISCRKVKCVVSWRRKAQSAAI